MEKGIPCKWKSKESWSSNTHIRWTRLLSTDWYKRQGKTVYNNLGINPRRHNNVNIYAPNTGGLQCLKQMLTATTAKTEVPACSSQSWPLLREVGGPARGWAASAWPDPGDSTITRLHTHTDGEPPTSHRRTNPPYDSWGSSWPCLWEAPWCRHGTRVSGSNFASIAATTVKPWPSYFSLSLSFLICRLSRNRNCCGRSSQPKHFHPHPPPHLAHSKARQDVEGTLWHSCLPLWTLSTPQPVSSFLQPCGWGPERHWDLLQVTRPVTWDGVRTDPRLGNNSYVKPQTVFPQRLVAPQEQYTCKAESTRTGWPRLIQFTARDSTTLVSARSLLAHDC